MCARKTLIIAISLFSYICQRLQPVKTPRELNSKLNILPTKLSIVHSHFPLPPHPLHICYAMFCRVFGSPKQKQQPKTIDEVSKHETRKWRYEFQSLLTTKSHFKIAKGIARSLLLRSLFLTFTFSRSILYMLITTCIFISILATST